MKLKFRTIQRLFTALALTWSATSFAYDPLDCLNDIVKIDPEINVGQGTRLCSATWSSEPVLCYAAVSVIDSGIPKGIAIDLCAGSVNGEKTVKCYVQAGKDRKLNRGLSTTLCGAKKVETTINQ
jgi:hypothetical protein